jgi:hypothetical protein
MLRQGEIQTPLADEFLQGLHELERKESSENGGPDKIVAENGIEKAAAEKDGTETTEEPANPSAVTNKLDHRATFHDTPIRPTEKRRVPPLSIPI